MTFGVLLLHPLLCYDATLYSIQPFYLKNQYNFKINTSRSFSKMHYQRLRSMHHRQRIPIVCQSVSHFYNHFIFNILLLLLIYFIKKGFFRYNCKVGITKLTKFLIHGTYI